MSQVDDLSPEASPESGVRRVNNLPMYIFGIMLVGFLMMMALVAMDRAQQQNLPAPDAKEKTGNTLAFAKEIAGDQTSGIIPSDHSPLVLQQSEQPPHNQKTESPPPPVMLSEPREENASTQAAPLTAKDEEAARIRQAKRQLFEEAVKARTRVQMEASRSTKFAPDSNSNGGVPNLAELRRQIESQRSTDPTQAYQDRLAQIRGIIGNSAGAGGNAGLQLATANGNSIAQFANAGSEDRWKLNSQMDNPASPYILRAGSVVPATLISGINSDLPGPIIAQVSQNVYDSPTGRYLLIPQGARLVGAYSSHVAYGQNRVLVAWQRITLPDGRAQDIGAMPGADSAGYAGLKDAVNNHYFRVFGSALLTALVTGGITYSQGQSEADSAATARTALSEALGNQLGQVTAQMIAKNINIAPTLEISPGYRFNVVVTKDLVFAGPYQAFNY